MATLQEFRSAVQLHAAVQIHVNTLVLGDAEKRIHREAISGYTEEALGPFRRSRQNTTVDALDIFQVDPDRIVDSLRPGEKAFQLRVWVIEEDLSADLNSSLLTAGVEIEVHRKVAFPDEEYLYTSDEMLADMEKLVDKSAWAGLPELDSLIDGPTIDIPERDNDVLRYTVAFSAVVAPN